MKLAKKTILVLLLTIVSSMSFSQTFNEYLAELPVILCPRKFKPDTNVDFVDLSLPAHLFDQTKFDLSTRRAIARVELDPNFPLILIKNTSSIDGYSTYTLYSFDDQGSFISVLMIAHSADGEGSTYSITPDNKIRVADYGASDAVINTYRYENGRFIKEGEPEYGDVDNLPDY